MLLEEIRDQFYTAKKTKIAICGYNVDNSFVQSIDTLTILNEITIEYENYLTTKENIWNAQLNSPFELDTPGNMNAHMGLALIRFAWAQVDGDVMVTELDSIFNEIDEHKLELDNFIEDDVITVISELKLFHLFISLYFL